MSMKVYTFDNITTGRKQETINAESEEAVIKIFAELQQQVVITDVFDPDLLFNDGSAESQNLGDLEPPLPGAEPPKQQSAPTTKEIFFETDGIKFKIVDGVVYRKDWIEIKGSEKDTYKIIRKSKAVKNGKDQDVTKTVCIFVNDWVKVKQNKKAN